MSATIVLVHGGFVDGAGWRGVYAELTAEGFDVRVVQNPTKSLADDVATTRDLLDAADVPSHEAAFMANSQVPWGLDALGGIVTKAAWREKPSWYLHVTEDRMIPPVAQTSMAQRIGATVVETPGSHAIYVSRPQVVADVIKQAAVTLA